MLKINVLKSLLMCLTALLIGLFVQVGMAGEASRPPWKIAIFRTAAPFAVEMEKGLKDGLAKLGYVEGQNLTYLPTVVVKSRIEDFAETAGLVKLKIADSPDLFATIGTQASIPAWKALESNSLPMVFSGVTFPVEAGLISAYNQPTGKNITGVGYSVSPKQRLELIRQMFPDTQRFKKIAFAYSGQVLQDATYVKYLRAAGQVADWQILYIVGLSL